MCAYKYGVNEIDIIWYRHVVECRKHHGYKCRFIGIRGSDQVAKHILGLWETLGSTRAWLTLISQHCSPKYGSHNNFFKHSISSQSYMCALDQLLSSCLILYSWAMLSLMCFISKMHLVLFPPWVTCNFRVGPGS